MAAHDLTPRHRGRDGRPRRVVPLVVLLVALAGGAAGLGGCAAAASSPPRSTLGTTAATTATDPSGVPRAAVGTPAASQRRTFAPSRIRLLSDHGAAAPVQVVDTGARGVLDLPEDPGRIGWWQSGSLAGELFGSVVLAGHIDSRAHGIGFFAQLLDARPGDRVELSGQGSRLVYVVRSNREVGKSVLSTDAEVFDRRTPGRLVLITCTGRFDPVTRHYDHNLVVVADPVGAPTAG